MSDEKNVLIVDLGGGGTFYVSSLLTIEEEGIFIFEVKASGQVCSCQQLGPWYKTGDLPTRQLIVSRRMCSE